MTSFTQQLSGHLAGLEYQHLSPEVVTKVKHLLLDYIGYTAYGSEEESAGILRSVIGAMGGEGEAGVIGHPERLPAQNAAFLNGAGGHMAELDDTHRGTQSHPGDSVLAAALAIADREHSTGKEFITAVVAGYEAAIRVGESVMPTHYTRGWHPSGTINTFGAAAAASKLLSLEEGRFTQAIAIAAGQAAGNFGHLQERGMLKDFNPGRAAANGVLAAQLADKGFTGSKDMLENSKGFGALYSDSFNPEKLTTGFEDSPKILEVAHKPYPGCRHLHSSRDALLEIFEIARSDGSKLPDDLESVTARIFSTGAAYVDDPDPWAPGKGISGPNFSVQFNLALMLLEGEEGLMRLYTPGYAMEKAGDERLRELMGKVLVVHDKELNREWPNKWASEVTLKTHNSEYVRRVDLPKGEPENPMEYQELKQKFRIMATAHAFTNKQSEQIRNVVENLDEIEDMTVLSALFNPQNGL